MGTTRGFVSPFHKRSDLKKLPVIIDMVVFTLLAAGAIARPATPANVEQTVDKTVQSLMAKYDIPGVAVGIVDRGKKHVFVYGQASIEDDRPVTSSTLFELGSVSKLFTAVLGSYAEQQGKLSLIELVQDIEPDTRGTSIGESSLLNLATYTAGGLPLQFPDGIQQLDQGLAYYKHWQPDYSPGTHRLYSNPSVGLFGYLVAKRLNGEFPDLIEQALLPALDLRSTYISVPPEKMGDYAYGYKDSQRIRVSPGLFDAEAYGIKSSIADMTHFIELALNPDLAPSPFSNAIRVTQKIRFAAGDLNQALGWELYAYPPSLTALRKGNSPEMIFKPNAVDAVTSATTQGNFYLNKTGSTNGFGAYIAVIPAKEIGIVLLANRNFPIVDRVDACYHILGTIDSDLFAKPEE